MLDTAPPSQVSPKSDFANTLPHLHNPRDALNAHVRDGRLPIDNNSVERLMKQIALSRKAWLFVCSVKGGVQARY